ncbi:hypothetical protein [Halobaculum lipolyticum]|uniref:Membrane protein 6-pyruvoyl-tetrahydropterin synthase-related domain-containing protein n=1 Tax=Halobaculum lipolyticum TaxID=3032001 RepID=A0ABD5WG02_9EURY|nr:hypothetical protein [Halobaculum sp. DT31]
MTDRGDDGADADAGRLRAVAAAADDRLRDQRWHRSHGDRLAAALFLALALAAFPPTLGEGFLLRLDMVFAPDASHLRFALDSKGPLYYGRLPFVALLDAVAVVVPDWLVQRAVLVGVVAGAGYAGYAAAGAVVGADAGSVVDADGRTDGSRDRYVARLFAGTLYAVNPFLYVRLLAGQWYFALGYAALPLAVVAFDRYFAGERERPTRALAWTTLVAVFDPHAAVLAAVAGGVLLVVRVAPARWGRATERGVGARDTARRTLARAGRFCALAVGVNAYWLVPAVAAVAGGGSQLATVDGADLAAFSPRGSVLGNVPLSVSMLYAFWRGGYLLPVDALPLPVAVGCFVCLLALAVYGWLDAGGGDDALGTGLALVGLVGAVLALGVAVPAVAPLYRAFAATPVGAGMREAGKFAALVALAYALLGARGVAALGGDLRATLSARATPPERRRAVAVAAALLVVALPLTYAFPMVAGFGGQLEPTDYPDDWHAVDDRLDADGEEYRVLYLPWHQYMAYDWAGGTVAAPAPLFFGPDTVASRDPDLGVGSQATDPTHRRLDALFADPPGPGFGEAVAPLGVKYVVVSRTADVDRYAGLDDDPALRAVSRGDDLLVYENRAFDGGDPASWPADGPRVPWGALLAGGVVSTATAGVRLRRTGRRTR